VLAFSSADHAQLQSLPAFVRRVELGPSMTLSETRAYLHGRLRRIDADGAIAARLTADRVAALHDASGGVPARLHALLDAWPGVAAAGATRAAQGEATPHAPAAAAPVDDLPKLPEAVRAFARRFERPAVRLSLITLVLIATLGAWLLAWQKGPGVASVGVPVQQVDTPHAKPAPQPPTQLAPALPREVPEVASEPPPEAADAMEPAAPAPEPSPPVESAPPAEGRPSSTESSAHPARSHARALVQPLPAAPPVPDPSRPELPVDVSTRPFPDEHVPALLEPEPLAAPPAGPRLSVNARPWAAIRLDGDPIGETPLGELRVAPGAHVVSATLPDGRVVERQVEARAGDLYVVFP
jgi:hypothetical protein